MSVASLGRRAAVGDRLALSTIRPAARTTQDRPYTPPCWPAFAAPCRPPVQKEAIFADDLLAMLATLDNDLRGLRDRAILAIGFRRGLRPLRIVGLDCGFRAASEDGTGWIEIFGAAKGAGAAKDEGRTPPALKTKAAPMFPRAAKEGGLLLTITARPAGARSRSDAAPAPHLPHRDARNLDAAWSRSPTDRCFAVSQRKTRASPRSV